MLFNQKAATVIHQLHEDKKSLEDGIKDIYGDLTSMMAERVLDDFDSGWNAALHYTCKQIEHLLDNRENF